MQTNRGRRTCGAALTLLCVIGLRAQAEPRAPESGAGQSARTIVILGASASAGFSDQFMTATSSEARQHNLTFRLEQALEPLFAADTVRFRDFSDPLMFQQPERIGAHQAKRAATAKADAVLAIDFMFWFGYSIRGGDQAARLELQQEGLAALAKIDRPLLVGDYPEMRDIDPRMLAPHAIPNAQTLRLLNERLREWAKERAHVRVFPLSSLMEELRGKNCLVEFASGSVELEPADLLQTDRLHVTRLGMAVMAHHATQALVELLGQDKPLQLQARSLPETFHRLDVVDLAMKDGKKLQAEGAARKE